MPFGYTDRVRSHVSPVLGEFFWGGDVEAGYRYQLAPSGITLDELRAAPNSVWVPLKSRYAKHTTIDANGIPRGYRGGSARRRASLSSIPRRFWSMATRHCRSTGSR
jgi:hypothetical protein